MIYRHENKTKPVNIVSGACAWTRQTCSEKDRVINNQQTLHEVLMRFDCLIPMYIFCKYILTFLWVRLIPYQFDEIWNCFIYSHSLLTFLISPEFCTAAPQCHMMQGVPDCKRNLIFGRGRHVALIAICNSIYVVICSFLDYIFFLSRLKCRLNVTSTANSR